MEFKSSRERRTHLNITPLVDVLFLLLIFFMLSTTFDRFSGMKLELPESSQSSAPERRDIVVNIDRKGNIFIDTVQTNIGELEEKVREYLSKNPNIPLVLRADRGIPHGFVVEVMDMAKRAGVRKIAIATRSRSGQ